MENRIILSGIQICKIWLTLMCQWTKDAFVCNLWWYLFFVIIKWAFFMIHIRVQKGEIKPCISCWFTTAANIQYIPRNMHTVFALLCFVVVIHWLIVHCPSGLLHWHCGNLTIAPVPAKKPWWIWINTSCEFIMNDCITKTKQSTTKPCAYFLGYTVCMHASSSYAYIVFRHGLFPFLINQCHPG